MSSLFLVTDPNSVNISSADIASLTSTPGFWTMIVAFFAIFLLIFVAIWIYQSLAYMSIARKAKQRLPGLAWIPGIGPLIISFRASKMNWWPWLLLIGLIFAHFAPVIYVIAMIVFAVYSVIWNWKMFERIHKPGWWALLCLIPIVGLVMIGIAAWSK